MAFELILRASTASNVRELAEFRNQAQRTIRSIDCLVSDIDADLPQVTRVAFLFSPTAAHYAEYFMNLSMAKS